MEEKYKKIPFDVERAKRVVEGIEPGQIVLKEGANVAGIDILSFSVRSVYSIVAVVHFVDDYDMVLSCRPDGTAFGNHTDDDTLMLQVPECPEYNEGDVLATTRGNIFILKYIAGDEVYAYSSLTFSFKPQLSFDSRRSFTSVKQIRGYATLDERQKFAEVLKASEHPHSLAYLKSFFGIEHEKPKCGFEPFQEVLVKYDDGEKWEAAFFSHYDDERNLPYWVVGSCSYKYCIPYNEKTKHLLGTEDNWEK